MRNDVFTEIFSIGLRVSYRHNIEIEWRLATNSYTASNQSEFFSRNKNYEILNGLEEDKHCSTIIQWHIRISNNHKPDNKTNQVMSLNFRARK